jgi:hypothetical protein
MNLWSFDRSGLNIERHPLLWSHEYPFLLFVSEVVAFMIVLAAFVGLILFYMGHRP